MKNKSKLITIVVISLIMIALLVFIFFYHTEKNSKKVKKTDTLEVYDYDTAVNIAKISYEEEKKKVQVIEVDNGYEIIVIDRESEVVLNIFLMDKKTGVISEITTSSLEKVNNSKRKEEEITTGNG